MEITNLGEADGLPPVDWAVVAGRYPSFADRGTDASQFYPADTLDKLRRIKRPTIQTTSSEAC